MEREGTGDRRQETGDSGRETVSSSIAGGDSPMSVQSAKELTVYRKGFDLAMKIYFISKDFPSEERFALTSQIRRSSRSVCLNLREAWAKRRYEAHFVSKLTDADGESNETDTALDFALKCGFMTDQVHHELVGMNNEVRKMLGAMIENPEPFLLKRNT
jgi:four helix bundle protein